jgi:hypothetical protein
MPVTKTLPEVAGAQFASLGANWRLQFIQPDGLPLTMAGLEIIDFGAISYKEIFQNVKTILATPLFSAALERTLGLDDTIVDRPINDAAAVTVAILAAVTQWEPRCHVMNISFEADAINGHLVVLLQLDIQNVIYGSNAPYTATAIFSPPQGVVQGLPPTQPPIMPPTPPQVPDPLKVNVLYIGANMRIVSLPTGGKIEVWNGTAWIEQVDYTEGTTAPQ